MTGRSSCHKCFYRLNRDSNLVPDLISHHVSHSCQAWFIVETNLLNAITTTSLSLTLLGCCIAFVVSGSRFVSSLGALSATNVGARYRRALCKVTHNRADRLQWIRDAPRLKSFFCGRTLLLLGI